MVFYQDWNAEWWGLIIIGVELFFILLTLFQVINFYLKLVVDQVNSGGTCKVHLFNSFFYPKLLCSYSGVRPVDKEGVFVSRKERAILYESHC